MRCAGGRRPRAATSAPRLGTKEAGRRTLRPVALGAFGDAEIPSKKAGVAASLRWTMPLAVVALAVLTAVTFRAHPGPGIRGQHLAVSGLLAAYVGALIAFELVPASVRWLRASMVAMMIVCGASLVGIQPDGPGYLMLMPPVAAACFRFERVAASVVVLGALSALAIAATFGRPRSLNLAILNALALAAYYGIATFASRFILADKQSQFMIAQLEETRAAQAQTAALRERQRLAREMHDVLAHSLSGLVLNLEGARLLAAKLAGNQQIEDVLGRAHSLARTGLEEAQRAIGMLRDDALPGPQGLEQLTAEFQADTGVPCLFGVSGRPRDLSSDCGLTLFRVAQEALTNVRKHAAPERVEITLTYEVSETRLVVEDFEAPEHDPPAGGGTGYGLTGMRERAELLGGTLTAAPTLHGFRVELRVPA